MGKRMACRHIVSGLRGGRCVRRPWFALVLLLVPQLSALQGGVLVIRVSWSAGCSRYLRMMATKDMRVTLWWTCWECRQLALLLVGQAAPVAQACCLLRGRLEGLCVGVWI